MVARLSPVALYRNRAKLPSLTCASSSVVESKWGGLEMMVGDLFPVSDFPAQLFFDVVNFRLGFWNIIWCRDPPGSETVGHEWS